jgi:hypothetical protein
MVGYVNEDFKMWKEAVISYLKLLSRNLYGRTDENLENAQ